MLVLDQTKHHDHGSSQECFRSIGFVYFISNSHLLNVSLFSISTSHSSELNCPSPTVKFHLNWQSFLFIFQHFVLWQNNLWPDSPPNAQIITYRLLNHQPANWKIRVLLMLSSSGRKLKVPFLASPKICGSWPLISSNAAEAAGGIMIVPELVTCGNEIKPRPEKIFRHYIAIRARTAETSVR